MYLLAGVVEGAGVVDYRVGGFDFFGLGQLGGHAAGDFFAGGLQINILAGGEAGDALAFGAGDDDEAVELVGRTGFEDEGSFDDSDRLWMLVVVALSYFFHPFDLVAKHGGVDNLVEFRDTRLIGRGIGGKSGGGELGAVDGMVGIEDLWAEVSDDFSIDGLAGEHEFVGDMIGLNQMRAQGNEHFPDSGFAGGDGAG
jgi:hypothetical protein